MEKKDTRNKNLLFSTNKETLQLIEGYNMSGLLLCIDKTQEENIEIKKSILKNLVNEDLNTDTNNQEFDAYTILNAADVSNKEKINQLQQLISNLLEIKERHKNSNIAVDSINIYTIALLNNCSILEAKTLLTTELKKFIDGEEYSKTIIGFEPTNKEARNIIFSAISDEVETKNLNITNASFIVNYINTDLIKDFDENNKTK
ncbi:MAG: hypothetical protein ACK5HP_04280 [Bacilli bacterium]